MELVTESKRALRGVLSRPFFTAAVLAVLGLGIGLNTAIFSLVHGVLLRSLPYRDPERIVRVWELRPARLAEVHRHLDRISAQWDAAVERLRVMVEAEEDTREGA